MANRAHHPVQARVKAATRHLAWGIMAGLAILTALLASRYLTLDPRVYFPEQRAVYEARVWGITLHAIGGMLAMLTGPTQFLASVRGRWPQLHRWFGRTYLAGVAIGGSAGLYMAPAAFGGVVPRVGFAALALAWLATGLLAYLHIRRGNVPGHRAWMVRSFALTFAAVTLRLEQPVLAILGVEFATAYAIVAWSSWLPNLAFAEWWIRRGRRRDRRPSSATRLA